MNLIIAESLITMYGLPVDFTATYHFGWKMGENLCKATGFILTTSGKKVFCALLFSLFQNFPIRKVIRFLLHISIVKSDNEIGKIFY